MTWSSGDEMIDDSCAHCGREGGVEHIVTQCDFFSILFANTFANSTSRTMPTYKLIYFNFSMLGESIRMILSYKGVEFEDYRVPMSAWKSLKKTIPFEKLPILEIDGKRYHQSQAILRFLAKDINLGGDSAHEEYEIDFVAGTIQDFTAAASFLWDSKDPDGKKELLEKLRSEIIPYYFKLWNEIAERNGGYLANGKLSWVDLYFYGIMNTFEPAAKTDCINEYLHLKLGREKVFSTPGIKEWIAKRPKTAY
ncbi:hypothetical protein GE061_016505 [Apolygus lucorum]|uniref:glutathione transferase n=1 Tax=Apolygus lucorum TaxID=248454 RepID=A0A8S9XKF5_APOLU|nr:hypothetical protein GE061_016505 [Apolygus lucorum]